MVVFFARSGARHPVLPAALGLLIGGSLSNLVDRIRLGHVTDFIDFGWWPAFNLADSFIVIGVAILLVALVAPTASRSRRGARSTSPRGEGAAGGGRRAARPLPRRRISARARRPSARSRRARSSTASRAAEELPARGRRAGRARRGAGRAAPAPRRRRRDRLAGRAPARRRQAGRVSSSTRARATRAGRSSTRSPASVAGGEPERPGIVHRLDRDTSGLMVVARSEEAHERLCRRSSASGRSSARYLALVRGRPALAHGPDRGADRPRPRRPDTHLARHRHAARGDHALRGRASCWPSTRCCG